MYLNKDSFRITKQSTWSNIKHTSIASSIGFVKTTFKYKVRNYLVQMNQIFLPEKIDLETDDENCQCCFMCQSCYREANYEHELPSIGGLATADSSLLDSPRCFRTLCGRSSRSRSGCYCTRPSSPSVI